LRCKGSAIFQTCKLFLCVQSECLVE